MSKKRKIKIFYNDVHSNIIKNNKFIGQGGPSRFAKLFHDYFSKQSRVILSPFLFSDGGRGAKPCVKVTSVGKTKYAEIIYDKEIIFGMFNKKINRNKFIEKIKPIMEPVRDFMKKDNPDVVFLNGFAVSNWILMTVAHELKIPTIIQHAGIWKMEVKVSQRHFHPSIRRVFYSLEKDTVKKINHHIFLNEFSKKVFEDGHFPKSSRKSGKLDSSIIPLPIDVRPKRKFGLNMPHEEICIGAVARWDAIKNHRSILRLASSRHKPANWRIRVVTKIPGTTRMQKFKQKYAKYVEIVKPMSSVELNFFYKNCDIVILPSIFDVSPTVVAESFVAGTPVIISENVGWVNLYKKFGLHDHIIKTNISGKDFISVIKHVISNRRRQIQHYKKFVNHIEQNHTTDVVLKKYLKLFEIYCKNISI